MRMRGHLPDRVLTSASVLSAGQHTSRPRVWFMPSASAWRFWPTTISRPHRRASSSRYSTMAAILYEVSMCTRGKGTWPKNALRASHSMTVESLPMDHSMQRFLKCLYASRKMYTL